MFLTASAPTSPGYFRFFAARISRDFKALLLYPRNWDVLPEGETRRDGSRHSWRRPTVRDSPARGPDIGSLKHRILAHDAECAKIAGVSPYG
jgi:hypothetical protein